MAILKNLRASDQSSFNTENRKDFVVRKRDFRFKQLYKFVVMSLFVAEGITLVVWSGSLYAAGFCSFMGVLLYGYAQQIGTYKKALVTAEFLNALFASSLSAGNTFCMVVKQDDGQIVYLDTAFQTMFPDMLPLPKRMLEDLLVKYNASDADRAAILQGAKQSTRSELTATLQGGSERRTCTILFSIEPIARPSGFCLIRGQEKI